ncbi:MAG: phosphate/phosphite/phosphonate ABC transporter substrate-binding protein [Methylococcaceae bacterium]|nr:phosphate/phosphite/phosphonate ABC transporter substrate-binding protein [Desulfuromonas sp.]NJD08160.1 phosphate/phosphite/phosphonate ABC transporter substrate-binding protein [Methylococcaceae bacterium]
MTLINALRALRLLAPLLFLLGIGMPIAVADARVYTIAVMPFAPPTSMHKIWAPFLDRLKQETGAEFKLKLFDRTAEFERDIWDGKADFMFASPIQEVVARESHGYIPLVRSRKMVTLGLFVRTDSPIRNVDDMAGKKVSFVGNKSLCSVFMQDMLSKYNNKLEYDKEYAGSVRNVVLNVILGKSDVGAVFIPELDNEPEETRNQLREVLISPEIAPHPLSAHPRVPAALSAAVQKAVLAMAATPEGAELLRSVRMSDPVAADYRRDYQSLETIDIKKFTNWGR